MNEDSGRHDDEWLIYDMARVTGKFLGKENILIRSRWALVRPRELDEDSKGRFGQQNNRFWTTASHPTLDRLTADSSDNRAIITFGRQSNHHTFSNAHRTYWSCITGFLYRSCRCCHFVSRQLSLLRPGD
jgi:hypothetical protein